MDQGLGSVDFLTVAEVALRLRVKPSWVYAHADDLGAYRLGKYLRFAWDRVLLRLEQRVEGRSAVGLPTQRPPITASKGKGSDAPGTDEEQKALDTQAFRIYK